MRNGGVVGSTFGLGRHLFFLGYLLSAAAASATVFLVAIRAVLIIVLILSTVITLCEGYLVDVKV
jgi:hypothetical protein